MSLEVIDHHHILTDMHLLVLRGGSPIFIIIVECLRKRKLHIFIEIKIIMLGHPVPVRSFMMDKETERLGCISLMYEIHCVLRNKIGGITIFLDIPSF